MAFAEEYRIWYREPDAIGGRDFFYPRTFNDRGWDFASDVVEWLNDDAVDCGLAHLCERCPVPAPRTVDTSTLERK